MLTYVLTLGGYQVLRNNVLWVNQRFDPAQPGFVPYATQSGAEAAAQQFIADNTPAATPAV